jgi:hypothetical protein
MTSNLDQIGAEAARLLQEGDNSKKLAQPLVDQIFSAFEEAKRRGETIVINGATGKTRWAEQAKVSLRYCQYVRRDGSRKGQKATRTTVRVANLDTATHVIVGGVRYKVRGLGLDFFPKCGTVGVNIEQPEEKPHANKKERLRHIQHPQFAHALCDKITLNKNNTAKGKRSPATCEKCIEAAKNITKPALTHAVAAHQADAVHRTLCGKVVWSDAPELVPDPTLVISPEPTYATCRECQKGVKHDSLSAAFEPHKKYHPDATKVIGKWDKLKGQQQKQIEEKIKVKSDERHGLSDDQPPLTLLITDECPTE